VADTDITVCNGALALIGESSISDFTSTDKAIICGNIYPKYANMLLAMHTWRFARKKSGTLAAATAPDNAYTLAFTVPSDFLLLVNAYNSGDASAKPLVQGYERFGPDIYTNETALFIDYNYTVDEDLWPDWYQTWAFNALASVFAMPITMNEGLENFYRQIAFGTPQEAGQGGMFKAIKGIDSRQQPAASFPIQSLTSARFR